LTFGKAGGEISGGDCHDAELSHAIANHELRIEQRQAAGFRAADRMTASFKKRNH
jgi:hypothetical protein